MARDDVGALPGTGHQPWIRADPQRTPRALAGPALWREPFVKATESQLAMRTWQEKGEGSSVTTPIPSLAAGPKPSAPLPIPVQEVAPCPGEPPPPRRPPPCKSRAEPGERGARPQGPAPTLHTRSPARAPVYSVPVYVGLTVYNYKSVYIDLSMYVY